MSDVKEIRIRSYLDNQELAKGFQEAEDRIRKFNQNQQTQKQQLQSMQKASQDPTVGKFAKNIWEKSQQEYQTSLRQQEEVLRKEIAHNGIRLQDKEKTLSSEKEKLKIIDQGTAAYKKQEDQVKQLEESIRRLSANQKSAVTTLEAVQSHLPSSGGTGGQPPGGPPNQGGGAGPEDTGPMGAFKKYLSRMTTAAGAAAIFSGGMNVWEDSITRDRRISADRGAIANMASRNMREGMSGQGSRGMFWAQEQAKAMRMASDEDSSRRTKDYAEAGIKGAAGAAVGGYAGMAGGAWLGAKAGALGGSLFGPAGTLIGGVGGAIVGGVGGAIGGAALGGAGAMGERGRARVFDQEKYNALKTKESFENYEANLAAEKAKDPRKSLAREYFEQNSRGINQLQKNLGMNTDAELTGSIMSVEQSQEISKNLRGGKSPEDIRGSGTEGWLQKQMRMGGESKFDQEEIEQQVQSLAAGGATTEGIRGLAGTAARYDRQFNLNNAGQTMGRLSGAGLDAKKTDAAMEKLLAEAVRLGVDTSKMPKEMERMTAITAELLTAGGVESKGMVDLFGAGLTGFDQKSMSAAVGTAEEIKDTSKKGGGWEGQMGYGYLMGDKAKDLLKDKEGKSVKLSSTQMNYINQMSAAEMDDDAYERLSKNVGIPVENMKKLMAGKDSYKQTRTGKEENAAKALGQHLKDLGPMDPEQRRKALSTGKGGELFQAYEMQVADSRGQEYTGKSAVERMSYASAQAAMAVGEQPGKFDIKTAEDKVKDRKEGEATRAGDIERGATATGDMARMKALNEYTDKFKEAAKQYTESAVEYNKQFELATEATKKGAKGIGDLATQLERLAKKMQDEQDAGVFNSRPKQDN